MTRQRLWHLHTVNVLCKRKSRIYIKMFIVYCSVLLCCGRLSISSCLCSSSRFVQLHHTSVHAATWLEMCCHSNRLPLTQWWAALCVSIIASELMRVCASAGAGLCKTGDWYWNNITEIDGQMHRQRLVWRRQPNHLIRLLGNCLCGRRALWQWGHCLVPNHILILGM